MIFLPDYFTKQPQLEVCKANTTLTSGLTLLAGGDFSYNYANGASLIYTVGSGTTVDSTLLGNRGKSTSGSASYNQTWDAIGNGDVTVLMYGAPTAAAAVKEALHQNGTNGVVWFGANTDENEAAVSGQLCLGLLQTGINRSSVKVASAIDGTLSCYVVGKRTGAGVAYKNGYPLTVTTSGTLGGSPTLAGDTVKLVGDSANGSFAFENTLILVAVWKRLLTVSEFASVSINPWQLFAPIPKKYWIQVSAGNTGTGSASFTFTATGIGSSLSDSTGSASFTFTPTGVGASTANATGSASVAFNATGVGASLANTTGSASFVFTATGVGASSTSGQGVGSADVVFNASAVGQSTVASTGSASFVFNATAVGTNASGAGSASFTFTATGVGTSGTTSSAVGTASFNFNVVGYSMDFVYPAKVILSNSNVTDLIIRDSDVNNVLLSDELVTDLIHSDIGNV